MSSLTGVIDYGAGNLGSVMNALKRLSVPARFVSGPEELSLSAAPFDRIIFPGDGHFASAMASLTQSGYAQAIREWIGADRPFLGICIGLQLLFESSEEAAPVNGREVKGLSIIPGTVRRFPCRKVPQIGWNQTFAKPGIKLFRGIPRGAQGAQSVPCGFHYYIHSYYCVPDDDAVCAAETEYHLRYCSAVERGALAAVQFHPEKSGAAGLSLLKNWVDYAG